MGIKKGQISIEYMAVLASMLLILVLLIIIFNGMYAQQALHTQYVRASHVLSVLSTSAKSVWIEGSGAYAYEQVSIPESVKLANSSIGNTSMSLYISNFGDAFEITDFNLYGWWPNYTGTVIMALRNNGTHVLLRPAALVSVSKTGMYFTLSGTDKITITNSANESFSVSQDLVFPDCGSCTYNDEGTNTIASGASRIGTVSIPSLSSGIYAGYLQINATPSDTDSLVENVTFNIPITVVR